MERKVFTLPACQSRLLSVRETKGEGEGVMEKEDEHCLM